MTVQTNPKAGQARDDRQRPEPTNLARRYGQIGIPALAAALRYAASAKVPAQTLTPNRLDERFWELAA
jgi:hypothetical protein